MNRRRQRSLRRLKNQLKRIGILLALLIAVILMICGCLYIGEHLFKKDKQSDSKKDPDETNISGDVQPNPDQTVTDPVLDLETQILNTYNYQYAKPNASGIHIVLDAGHGGVDGGTQAGEILEKDVNLTITKKVQTLLEEAGATVTMTRETDDYVDLADRTRIGNQASANLFLSLHCNSYEDDSSITGLEVYYHKNSDISKQYAEAVTQALKDTQTIRIREASKQNMQVLRNSSNPAIMIEMGFLSNPEECANLTDPLYQEFISRMIVEKVISIL